MYVNDTSNNMYLVDSIDLREWQICCNDCQWQLCLDCEVEIMASKRFVKPLRLESVHREKTLEDWNREDKARTKSCEDEYRYCLAEAKRLHPDWTLAQRRAYARESANSLFD